MAESKKLTVMQVKLPEELKERILALEENASSRHELLKMALDSFEGKAGEALAQAHEKIKTLGAELDKYGCTPDVVSRTIQEKERLYDQVNDQSKRITDLESQLASQPSAPDYPHIKLTEAQMTLLKRISSGKDPVSFIFDDFLIPFLNQYPKKARMEVVISDQDFQAYQEYLQNF